MESEEDEVDDDSFSQSTLADLVHFTMIQCTLWPFSTSTLHSSLTFTPNTVFGMYISDLM